jgi:hypothetical protein
MSAEVLTNWDITGRRRGVQSFDQQPTVPAVVFCAEFAVFHGCAKGALVL